MATLDQLKDRVETLSESWNVFTRHMFLFMKSLQKTVTTVGGSPIYFQTAQDVMKYFDYTLANPSSDRDIVETWLQLRAEVIKVFQQLTIQMTSVERPLFHDVIAHISSLTSDQTNIVHLCRLNYYAMTELERRILGGVANLIPVLLEGIQQLVYEVQFIRKDQMRSDMEVARRGDCDHNDGIQLGGRNDNSPHFHSTIKDLDSARKVTMVQTQQQERKEDYRHNQVFQRGLPFSDWKMNYINLGNPI